eukprot:gene27321-36075_t
MSDYWRTALPLQDLVFYQVRLISHTYLRSLLGETAAAVADDDALSSPPYVAISDSFAGLLPEGLVSEHRGRLAAARGKQLFIRRADTQTDTETPPPHMTKHEQCGHLRSPI